MDVFDTASLRQRVLAAWSASPARFREDANAEEELVRGAYRDRVIIELAQNAADAAARAGVAARLLLRLHGSSLIAANTGAPLDAAGVEGLSTLRASTKRTGAAVGRFGVGFAAVLGVSDAPAVLSRTGGVRWSRDETRAAAAGIASLAAEVQTRGAAVPVLRLPFAVPAESVDVPDGYDTAVHLPLRDDDAVRLVHRLLGEVDAGLLLALPALTEVIVDVDGAARTLDAGAVDVLDEHGDAAVLERRLGEQRWRLATSSGEAAGDVLAARPFEERIRPGWSVTVAVPVDGDKPQPVVRPAVIHAPTPTDDRTDLAALVIASFPLDSTRRRVADDPLTEFLTERVAAAYAALVASFTDPAVLELIPGPLGTEPLDVALHRAVRDALGATPFVPAPDGARLRPRDTVLVEGLTAAADPSALATVVAGLPVTGWLHADVLAGLGATVRPLAEVVDDLTRLDLDAEQWHTLYTALDGADLESLGALPVPLADGRTVRGPRGLLLPGDVDPALLEPFALRVVAPAAAHPLLRRLGATTASAASVLRDPLARAGVAEVAAADGEAGPVADAVLGLVAEAGVTVDDEPWLAELPLRDATGADAQARELFLPGSPVLAALDADPDEYTVDAELVDRFGPSTLAAVGVRSSLDTVRDADVVLDADLWHDLDDEDGWVAEVQRLVPSADVPPVISDFVAVRDLDLVRADAWPQVLAALAADPQTRSAVVEPVFVLTGDGARRAVPSYAAWWLKQHARLDGHAPPYVCAADADPVVRALLHPVALPVDDAFAATIGIVRSIGDADAGVLLERLADDTVDLGAARLGQVYAALAERDPAAVDPPSFVRIPDGVGTRVVPAADVVVCAAPYWLQLGLPGALPGSAELADLLDVDLAAETVDVHLSPGGHVRDVPAAARAVVPEAPQRYVEHDDLYAGDVPLAWWIDDDTIHACTLDGLARALAWVCGQWDKRWLLGEILRDPAAAGALLTEDVFT